MTMVEFTNYNLLNIYRSSSTVNAATFFLDDFLKIFDPGRKTLLVGDLNVCSVTHVNHPIFKLLSKLMFKHYIKQTSHKDGNVIDYASHYCPQSSLQNLKVQQFAQYFTDHDMLLVDITDLLKVDS